MLASSGGPAASDMDPPKSSGSAVPPWGGGLKLKCTIIDSISTCYAIMQLPMARCIDPMYVLQVARPINSARQIRSTSLRTALTFNLQATRIVLDIGIYIYFKVQNIDIGSEFTMLTRISYTVAKAIRSVDSDYWWIELVKSMLHACCLCLQTSYRPMHGLSREIINAFVAALLASRLDTMHAGCCGWPSAQVFRGGFNDLSFIHACKKLDDFLFTQLVSCLYASSCCLL